MVSYQLPHQAAIHVLDAHSEGTCDQFVHDADVAEAFRVQVVEHRIGVRGDRCGALALGCVAGQLTDNGTGGVPPTG